MLVDLSNYLSYKIGYLVCIPSQLLKTTELFLMMQQDTPLNLLTNILAMSRGCGKISMCMDEVIILTMPKLYATQLYKNDN